MPALSSAVKVLIAANVAVFVLGAILGQWAFGMTLSEFLGVSWHGMWEGFGVGIVRLLTYQFAHSYLDPLHILFNMLVLYFFGTFVESTIGRRGLIHLYLVGGVCGALLHMLVAAFMSTVSSVPFEAYDVPLIGASGACYAILVYAAFVAPRQQVIFIVFPVELRWLVGILVGLGVYSLLLEFRGEAGGGVSHGAHLGGAAWGAIAFTRLRTYYMTLGFGNRPMFGRFAEWKARRAQEAAVDRQKRLDELLDKVHREGMGALTTAERRFLEKASRDMKK